MSLTGRSRGPWKIGAVAGTHGPPHPPIGTGRSAEGRFSGVGLSGWVKDENDGLQNCGPQECGAAS